MKVWLLLLCLMSAAFAQPASHDIKQVERWKAATVPAHRLRSVQVIVDRIQKDWPRYVDVSEASRVPPAVISGLHNMEASGSFKHHLHEGSSLRARTRYIPKGRPKTGNPPFTWEYSAKDALLYDRMGDKNWQKLGAALTAMENYNGAGYWRYHPSTPTPYLWSGTTVERPGKYVADSKWSPTARSQQIGIAALWKEMERRKMIVVPKP
jgi:lysozyme family protein